MKCKTLPPQEYLKECFDYNPETGEVAWKHRPIHHFFPQRVTPEHYMRSWNKRYAGQICTNKSRSGCKYLNIRINKTCYLLHRVIWKLMHGADPKSMIDHIDGDCFNLRASNLREATNGQNQANGRIQKNNSTGVKGVRLVPSGRFQASIGHDNKAKYLGLFDTKEAAHAAYCKAANELHKEFANYGN